MGRLRGLDTNVLVHFFTRDDPGQSAVALRLFRQAERKGERLHVSTVVLAELIWTLGGRLYRYDRTSIADVIQGMLDTPLFDLQSRDRVRRALGDYRHGSAGFVDYLVGHLHRAAGCVDTATFDRRLKSSELFKTLG